MSILGESSLVNLFAKSRLSCNNRFTPILCITQMWKPSPEVNFVLFFWCSCEAVLVIKSFHPCFVFLIRYGDRTPKTFLGRTFGVVWILVGAIMLSLFTALFTNTMQAALDGTRCQDIDSKVVSAYRSWTFKIKVASVNHLFLFVRLSLPELGIRLSLMIWQS